MDRFSKFKFLYALKLNFNGGQFYKNNSKSWEKADANVILLWSLKLSNKNNPQKNNMPQQTLLIEGLLYDKIKKVKKLSAPKPSSGRVGGWISSWVDGGKQKPV